MPTNVIPPIGINVSYASAAPFTASALQQRMFFTDKTNPAYLRQATMTQDGVYLQVGTASVVIPFANLYAVASYALPQLNWPPVITAQPTSSAVVHPAAVYFVVAANVPTGTSANYQWYSASFAALTVFKALSNIGTYNGTATPALTHSSTIVADSGSGYFCYVSNGSGAVSSSIAILNVS